MEPKVSVVVPAHNVGAWIGQTLDSILHQDVPLEVIVVDDGSTDDTLAVVQAVAARDSRVRVVAAVGSGGAQARDYGVELATGEYIAFADGDDLVPDGAYQAMLRSAEATGSDMVVGRFFKFFPTRTWHPTLRWAAFDEPRQKITLAEQPSLINNRACWNRLFRREWWLAEAITFPTVPRSNDTVPMTKALTRAKSIDVVRDHVYLYRDRPGNSSMTAKSVRGQGFESYLSQEFECRALISSVGADELLDEYDNLLIDRDGWVHLSKFLRNEEWRALDRSALSRIHGWIARLAGATAACELPRSRSEVRWAWALAAAGRWEEAARVAKAVDSPADRRVWPEPEDWLQQAKEFRARGHMSDALIRQNLIAHVVEPIASHKTQTSAELATRLSADADLIGELLSGAERGELTPAQQLVMQMLSRGEAGRSVPAVPRVYLQSIQLVGRAVRITITSGSIEAVSGLRLYSPEAEHELRLARHGDDAYSTEIDLDLLGASPWKLLCEISTPDGVVEQRLPVRPDHVVTRLADRVLTATDDRRLCVRMIATGQEAPADALDRTALTAQVTRLEILEHELRLTVALSPAARVSAARLWNETPGRAGTRSVSLRQRDDTLIVARSANDLPDRAWTLVLTYDTSVGRIEVPTDLAAGALAASYPGYRVRAFAGSGFRITPSRAVASGAAASRTTARGGRGPRWKARLKKFVPAPLWRAAKVALKG